MCRNEHIHLPMAQNATTTVFIDKYHPQRDGKCAISIRVTHQRKKKYYPTIYSLTTSDFEKVKSFLVNWSPVSIEEVFYRE